MLFGADEVGEQLVTFPACGVSIFAVFGDEAYGNSGDRSLHWDTSVHQREHPATDARHRGRSIRFHDLARDANGVTKVVFARHNRFERTLRQSTVADLAPACATGATGLSHTERRKIVMQNKTLRSFAAAVGVDVLRFFDRSERGEREGLSFAALENGRTMRAGQHAHFATD